MSRALQAVEVLQEGISAIEDIPDNVKIVREWDFFCLLIGL